MNDRPEYPDESWQPLEDHEQPTRRIDRIEPDPDWEEAPPVGGVPVNTGDVYDDEPAPEDPAPAEEEEDPSLQETRLSSIPDLPFDPMAPYEPDDEGGLTQPGQVPPWAAEQSSAAQAPEDELPLRRIRRDLPQEDASEWTVVSDATPPTSSDLDELPVRPVSADDIPSRGYEAPGGHNVPRVHDAPTPYSVPQTTPPPPLYGGFSDSRPRSRRRGKTARERRDSGLYLPWWTLLILLAGVALVATLGILGLSALGGQFAPGGETPVVIVITSTPTRLPTERPTLIATTTPFLLAPSPTAVLASPTPAIVEPTLPPEAFELRVGATVEITEVGTAGLNIREGAGTNFRVLFIAPEGGRFEVIGGPETVGDLTWWQLQGVDNPNQTGWAVAEYLSVVVE